MANFVDFSFYLLDEHFETIASEIGYKTLKFYAIRKYSFYLLTNEIVVILSTE